MTHSILWSIVRFEWRRLWRDGSSMAIAIGLISMLASSLYLSHHQFQVRNEQQQKAHAISQAQWAEQPDRHPHRVSHFGDFVFKPAHVLAGFDEGANAFTGHVLFLEPHRQNSANFNDATESSALLRFGQLTPAFVLQTLMPLVLIFVGFSIVSQEREQGSLQQLIASSVKPRQIIFGKLLALAIPSLVLILLLGAAGMLFLTLQTGSIPLDSASRIALLMLSYTLYLLIWCVAIIAISTMVKHSQSALVLLIALWLVFCIASPRLSYEIAHQLHPTPGLVEADFAAEAALEKIGDSHNPDDPHFNTFKNNILKQYGVEKVEDLPINYNGLLMHEGERLSTQVYSEQHQKIASLMMRQSMLVNTLAWANPAIAIQQFSRAASGSNLAHHQQFLADAEQQRYKTVQYLNELQAHEVKHENDKEQRISAAFWQKAPRENIILPNVQFAMPALLQSIAVLITWLLLGGLLLNYCIRYTEK
jgi:ABC-2 type transport system permease protein